MYSSFRGRSEVTIIQAGHIEDKITIAIEVTVDSRDLVLHQGLPADIKIDVSLAEIWPFCYE